MLLKRINFGVVFLFCLELTNACIFKYDRYQEKEPERIAKFGPTTYQRKNSTAYPCVCGGSEKDQRQSWVLYIHIKISEKEHRVCPGTIINSNMIITSSKCLTKPGKKINILDVWKKRGNVLFSKSDLKISTFADSYPSKLGNIAVKDIILQEKFGVDESFGVDASDADFAIILVEHENFLSTQGLGIWPVCLPQYNELPMKKIVNRKAYYAGVRGWDDDKIKAATEIRHNQVFILPADKCKMLGSQRLNTSDHTICLRYAKVGPTTEGGPLTIKARRYIEGGNDRSFLIGVATWVQTEKDARKNTYAYFSNVNEVIPFIEKEAEKAGSEWCETPTFFDDSWPWEGFTKEHEKSIDCECGKKPKKGVQGRIINGDDATMYEFPWMVKLKIHDGGECGGSIINDRVILTAAHCVVDKKRRKLGPGFNLDPAGDDPSKHEIYLRAHNFDVTLEPKPIQVFAKKVFFHPGFPDLYEGGLIDFDVAVIILNDTLEREFKKKDEYGDPYLVPICLPKAGHLETVIKEKLYAVISGWGQALPEQVVAKQKAAGITPVLNKPILQKLTVPVHDIFTCTDFDKDKGTDMWPTDTKICAGTFSHNKDVYSGDSGGPLVVESQTRKFTQIGVVSYTFLHPNKQLGEYFSSTNYGNVEAFLPYIYYYSDRYEAKTCKK